MHEKERVSQTARTLSVAFGNNTSNQCIHPRERVGGCHDFEVASRAEAVSWGPSLRMLGTRSCLAIFAVAFNFVIAWYSPVCHPNNH